MYQPANWARRKLIARFALGKIETKPEFYDNYYPLEFSHNNNHGYCSALYQLQFILEND